MGLPHDITSGQVITAQFLNQIKNEIFTSIIGDGQIMTHQAGQNLTVSMAQQDAEAKVMIRNNSGGDIAMGGVLGLDEPIETPDPATPNTILYPTFKGVKPKDPDHRGTFAILLAGIKSGETGPAILAGVAVVKISVADDNAANSRVEIVDGSSSGLVVDEYGSVGVLWRAGGTGSQWAVVRLGIAARTKPFKLTPCSVDDGTEPRYTTDDMKQIVGKVVKVDGQCYVVSVASDAEAKCIVPECGMSWGVYDSCCMCHGYRDVTLTPCAGGVAVTKTVESVTVEVGKIVRIEGECFTVTAVAPCSSDTAENMPADLVFVDCESCAGSCWTLTLCGGDDTQDVRGPNLNIGDVIFLSGACWEVTAAVETCAGTEAEIDPTAEIISVDCDTCKGENFCDLNGCTGKNYATQTSVGADATAAGAAAKAGVIAAAKSAADGKGISVCKCTTSAPTGEAPTVSVTADLCWSPCCPEGYKQIEYVWRVRCVDGEIIYDTKPGCVLDVGDCTEECL